MKKSELGSTMRKMKRREFEEMIQGMVEHEIVQITKGDNTNTQGRPVLYVEIVGRA